LKNASQKKAGEVAQGEGPEFKKKKKKGGKQTFQLDLILQLHSIALFPFSVLEDQKE
jgi:hypothetical protein